MLQRSHSPLCIALVITACSGGPHVPAAPVLPPLEAVPFEQLAPGKLIFDRVATDGRGFSGTYVIDVDARSTSAVSTGRPTHTSAISPDGSRIAFSSLTDLRTVYDIYIVELLGRSVRQATAIEGQDRSPSWTPGGAQIVFSVFNPNPVGTTVYRQLPVANAPDRVTVRTFKPGVEVWPGQEAWGPAGPVSVAPSGQHVFVDEFGWRAIFSMESDGSNLTLLAELPRDIAPGSSRLHAPTWSPTGDRIAFLETLHRSDGWLLSTRVRIMDADGTNSGTLVEIPAGGLANVSGSNNLSLCWSADGAQIAFSSPVGDLLSHIFVVRSDGADLTQITFASGVTDRSVSCSR